MHPAHIAYAPSRPLALPPPPVNCDTRAGDPAESWVIYHCQSPHFSWLIYWPLKEVVQGL